MCYVFLNLFRLCSGWRCTAPGRRWGAAKDPRAERVVLQRPQQDVGKTGPRKRQCLHQQGAQCPRDNLPSNCFLYTGWCMRCCLPISGGHGSQAPCVLCAFPGRGGGGTARWMPSAWWLCLGRHGARRVKNSLDTIRPEAPLHSALSGLHPLLWKPRNMAPEPGLTLLCSPISPAPRPDDCPCNLSAKCPMGTCPGPGAATLSNSLFFLGGQRGCDKWDAKHVILSENAVWPCPPHSG